MSALGTKYVIFDDSAMPITKSISPQRLARIKQALLRSPDLHVVFQTDFLTVLENTSFIGEIFLYDAIVVVDSLSDMLGRSQLNNPVVVLREDMTQLNLPTSLTVSHEQYASYPKDEGSSRIIHSRRTFSTSYELSVLIDKPFLLVISESYDPLWTAVVNGQKEYPSIPVNGVVNGYWIEETGSLKIRVEYKPQRAFTQGAVLSFSTAVMLVIYIAGRFFQGRDFHVRRG